MVSASTSVSPASATLSISLPDCMPQIFVIAGSGSPSGMLIENSPVLSSCALVKRFSRTYTVNVDNGKPSLQRSPECLKRLLRNNDDRLMCNPTWFLQCLNNTVNRILRAFCLYQPLPLIETRCPASSGSPYRQHPDRTVALAP